MIFTVGRFRPQLWGLAVEIDTVTVFFLDRSYRILRVDGHFRDVNLPFVGGCLWDAYPDAEPSFGPVYERAWDRGWCYKVIPYRGCAMQVHANRCSDDVLCSSVMSLSLDGLQETIRELLDASQAPPLPEPSLAEVIPIRQHAR